MFNSFKRLKWFKKFKSFKPLKRKTSVNFFRLKGEICNLRFCAQRNYSQRFIFVKS
jgi:hypothetical protein